MTATGTVNLDLLKCYSQFPKATVLNHRNSFWNDTAITAKSMDEGHNMINDMKILLNTLGKFLLSTLTLSTQNKVKIEINDYTKTLNG